jgi:hypothetical protein
MHAHNAVQIGDSPKPAVRPVQSITYASDSDDIPDSSDCVPGTRTWVAKLTGCLDRLETVAA